MLRRRCVVSDYDVLAAPEVTDILFSYIEKDQKGSNGFRWEHAKGDGGARLATARGRSTRKLSNWPVPKARPSAMTCESGIFAALWICKFLTASSSTNVGGVDWLQSEATADIGWPVPCHYATFERPKVPSSTIHERGFAQKVIDPFPFSNEVL